MPCALHVNMWGSLTRNPISASCRPAGQKKAATPQVQFNPGQGKQRLFTFETAASGRNSDIAHIIEMAIYDVEGKKGWESLINPSLHGVQWIMQPDAAKRSGRDRCLKQQALQYN